MQNPKIFIVIAAYNEEKTIAKVIDDLHNHGYQNIIVVDDGSQDKTAPVAELKGATVLKHIINRGQGAALRTGIEYALDQIAKRFIMIQNQFALPKPIPIIVSGGTSLPGSFVEFFISVFERKKKRFPIEISEIRHASQPMNAVANGMLVQAIQEYEE